MLLSLNFDISFDFLPKSPKTFKNPGSLTRSQFDLYTNGVHEAARLGRIWPGIACIVKSFLQNLLPTSCQVWMFCAPKEDLQYFNILNYIEFIALFQTYRITLKCRISKMLIRFQYIEYIALDGPISKI